MSDFSVFGKAVHNAFNSIVKKDDGKKDNVFVVDATGDELWAHYLASFPEGTNPIFRTRTEYDCSCCRNFVKNIGAVVYMKNGELLSVWDVTVEDELFQIIANSMSEFVKALPIKQHFIVSEPAYGAEQTNTKGEVWNHFHAKVPTIFQWKHNESDYIGERKNDVNGLKRSIDEISDEAIEIVAELIDQDSLYKGVEYKWALDLLLKLKRQYAALETEHERESFLWENAKKNTRIHGIVIGTLLVNITEGMDLEMAVGLFETYTGGPNFKRPKALVTQRMIDEAQKLVEKMGLEDSLARRYATREDISVNDVLFVDGSVKKKLLGGAFDAVKPTKKAVPELKDVEDISIKDFLSKVLPKADTLEVLVKNEHTASFVSLIAPVNPDAKPLLKWDNAFSWSYIGEVTSSSIRERVKKAGGKIDGDVRVSLSWQNGDDLDLSVNNGRDRCCFRTRSAFGATLDVDMNAGHATNSSDPVENIFWTNKSDIKKGRYEIQVHNWSQRSTNNVGFDVEVEVLGKTYSFAHPKVLDNEKRITVGYINVDAAGSISVEGMAVGAGSSVENWGIKTEEWTPVDLITKSPNFWNDQAVGHEHVFFMLKGCVNEEGTRGFYNEYLRDELHKHRKVFEVVSAQMKVPASADQLSGLGFSVNDRAEMQVRVKGAINRVLNVKF
ncbi:hypothetical protein RYA05_02785 [Pseudomonas syringae pv. actinidiae]|nr:hypothetical protein [Pseudomonas syringae pv. actinidiae]